LEEKDLTTMGNMLYIWRQNIIWSC